MSLTVYVFLLYGDDIQKPGLKFIITYWLKLNSLYNDYIENHFVNGNLALKIKCLG